MRRTAIVSLCLAGLVIPAAALASRTLPTDGQLVVRGGQAPASVPVVTLTIDGSVIATVQGAYAKLVVATLNQGDGYTPEVSGDAVSRDMPVDPKAPQQVRTVWTGTSFRFRSIGMPGHYVRITIYGSYVDLVAIGNGSVRLAGTSDAKGDGSYSITGSAFRSLPAQQTDWLTIGTPAGG